jgi:hypothetical protein
MPKIKIEKEVPDNDCVRCEMYDYYDYASCNLFNRVHLTKLYITDKIQRCPECIAATVKE